MLQCVRCGAKFPSYPLRSVCEKCEGTLEYVADEPKSHEIEFSDLSGSGDIGNCFRQSST